MLLGRKGNRSFIFKVGSGLSSGRGAIVLMGVPGGSTPPPGEGLDSLSEEGETELTGDITFSEGSGITLTQVGQDIEISLT